MKRIDKEKKFVTVVRCFRLFYLLFILFVLIPLAIWNHDVSVLQGIFVGVVLACSYNSL